MKLNPEIEVSDLDDENSRTLHRTLLSFVLLLAFVLVSCKYVHITTKDGSSIDLQQAQTFSVSLIDDLVRDRRKEAYLKMEKAFQSIMSQEDFEANLTKLYGDFGQPLEYEYLRNMVTVKTLYNNETKPLRKLYYAVTTTKYPKSVYYLTIEVVPDGEHLAATGVFYGKS